MFKKIFLFNVIFIYLFCTEIALSKQSNFFKKGIDLYEKNQFEKSKIFFEKDIVFNPKNESSYLYLAKIFNNGKNEEQEEVNLKNVLLINIESENEDESTGIGKNKTNTKKEKSDKPSKSDKN